MWIYVSLLSVMLVICNSPMCLSCGAAQYEVKKECCPKCDPGYHVYRHCTEDTSTTCAPCPISTYTDEHNGLRACRMCGVCHLSAGLKVKRNCTSTSDTLCEPLEGYYCTDPIPDGCQGAVEHTQCKPGQFIRQQGSAYLDAVCEDCPTNSYSNGNFTICKPHTQCNLYIMDVITKGTPSSDTHCGRSAMIRGVTFTVVLGMLSAIVMMLVWKSFSQNRTNNENEGMQMTGGEKGNRLNLMHNQ
ncbi:tumor necrosis factor receptor superfamily member 14-like [Engraulis encrasicolus]|uniref:tumor necrosis factor receptor superfamily member 14-like n=1 Tax=Engraulis encrasicolus TaxID=184585 RepID=UPI002FD249EA